MAGVSVKVSACLCPLCLWRADGGSGHTCLDREAFLKPYKPHHLLAFLLLHKRPHVTPDPTGNRSYWGKALAVTQQEQCSVVSKTEGGRDGGKEEEEEIP